MKEGLPGYLEDDLGLFNRKMFETTGDKFRPVISNEGGLVAPDSEFLRRIALNRDNQYSAWKGYGNKGGGREKKRWGI